MTQASSSSRAAASIFDRRLLVVSIDQVGERTRIHYPELGLAVEHRRVDDPGDAIIPLWLASALG